MSIARLVITAVTVEKRPVSEVAKSYGAARSWVYAVLARYQAARARRVGSNSANRRERNGRQLLSGQASRWSASVAAPGPPSRYASYLFGPGVPGRQ
jgi:hypothetical protein